MSHRYFQDFLNVFNSITPEVCRASTNYRFSLAVYHKLRTSLHDGEASHELMKAVMKIPVDINSAELSDDELNQAVDSFSDAATNFIKVLKDDFGISIRKAIEIFDWSAIKVSLN